MCSHTGTNNPELLHAELESQRFIPKRAAAPQAPDTTHLVSFKVLRMCSRSASSKVRRLASPWLATALVWSPEWHSQHRTRGQNHRMFDQVLQLTNISGHE